MSKIEKIIIIALIVSALGGVILSYHRKISRSPIEIAPIDITGENYKPENMIAQRKIININTAGIDTLAKLPGIGPKLARRIIDYRRQSGKFNSPDELMKVKGVGPAKYQSIKDRLRVD